MTGREESPDFQAGFLLGLEQRAEDAYEQGYADAEVTLQEVVGGWLQANPSAQVIRAMEARAARDAARDKPLDSRTPQQVQRDAYASWDLDTPPELAAAAGWQDRQNQRPASTNEQSVPAADDQADDDVACG